MSRLWPGCVGVLTLLLALPAEAVRAQADVGEKVFQQALRSTVFIVVPLGGSKIITGSGSVIDARQRLVLTNFHVVGHRTEALVMFPMFEKGRGRKLELIVERDRYIRAIRTPAAIRGKVLFAEPRCDLAVIQLDRLPPGTPALRLAPNSVVPGQRVHSIGNPGFSRALWVYTPGSVRAVYRQQLRAVDHDGKNGFNVDARIVVTSSAVNPGDSGGPVLNDKGELVAVTQGHADESKARSVSFFIDVREIHDLLAEKKVHLTTPPTAVTTSAEATVPKPAAKPLGEGDANFILAAAKSLLADGKRDRARERLEDLIKQHPETKAAAEAKKMLEKLGGK